MNWWLLSSLRSNGTPVKAVTTSVNEALVDIALAPADVHLGWYSALHGDVSEDDE